MCKLLKKTKTKINSTDDQMHISRDFCPHLPLQSFYIPSPYSCCGYVNELNLEWVLNILAEYRETQSKITRQKPDCFVVVVVVVAVAGVVAADGDVVAAIADDDAVAVAFELLLSTHHAMRPKHNHGQQLIINEKLTLRK
ncbi:hypothetical protein P5673_020135 [Acropora cervicornis]|uniref:Uncharacterized protein n=1 Tax=Acropora cervicornis TaxID=6130 RepID=A0AAD9QAS2_ACRCE|nr:hypothetical protein P5673_020135 [Acropora cervicornis]